MSQFTQFQIYQHMTFKNAMIENQVNVKVLIVIAHPFLTCYEAKATPQFKEKLLQMVN